MRDGNGRRHHDPHEPARAPPRRRLARALPRFPRARSRRRLDVRAASTRRRRSSSSSGTSSITTPPTTSSPTSRKARAACATCRRCCGSRAPRGSGRTWRELAQGGPHHDAGGARRFAAGALHRRDARAPALPRRPPRGPARVRPAERAGAQLGLVDTPARRASEQLMQRYYRAAKLVRQVNMILLQNLHARLFPASTGPSPIDDEFVAVDELLDIARREAVRAAAGGDARRVPDDAAPSGAEGHVGADAARAVAQPRPHRRRVPPRPREPRALHRRCSASRAA